MTTAVPDPHWDRVIEIAALLWVDGVYVVDIEPTPTQEFVDLQWAARHAGRVLGRRTAVDVGRVVGDDGSRTRVTVTFADPGEADAPQVEARLEELMRKVLEDRLST